MSHTSKFVLSIAVFVLVLAGGYVYWQNTYRDQVVPGTQDSEVTTLPSGTDTSNASLEQDVSSIDSQIKKVGDDTASVTESVNASVAQ